MDEDDLLGHLLVYGLSFAHKFAFKRGVHVIEIYKNLSGKGFSKDIIRFTPKIILF